MRCAAPSPNQKRLQLPLIRETLVLAARRAQPFMVCRRIRNSSLTSCIQNVWSASTALAYKSLARQLHLQPRKAFNREW